MARRKKPSLGRAIVSLVTSCLSIDTWLTKILGLVKAEIRLTYQSLLWIVVFAVFAMMAGFSIWVLLLIVLYLYLISLHIGFYLPLFVIILLNVILLLCFIFKIYYLQKKLFAKKRL